MANENFKIQIVEINVDEMLQYAAKELGQFKNKAPMAVRTAINNAAKKAKKLDEKTAKSLYTDRSKLNSLKFTRASVSNLTAILQDKGANVSLRDFKYRRGRTLSVLINKRHGYKNLFGKTGRKPFFADETLRNGGSGIMFRKEGEYMKDFSSRRSRNRTKHTEALEKMYSLSSPVQHGNPEVWDSDVSPAVEKDIYMELDEQIARIWARELGA